VRSTRFISFIERPLPAFAPPPPPPAAAATPTLPAPPAAAGYADLVEHPPPSVTYSLTEYIAFLFYPPLYLAGRAFQSFPFQFNSSTFEA